MRIIIAGSRNFNNYELLKKTLDGLLDKREEIEIVSGAASGADYLGELYAKENGYKLTKLLADWQKYGKAAGPIRNKQMAQYADGLVLFWDGNSRGSKNMLENAKKEGLEIKEVKI